MKKIIPYLLAGFWIVCVADVIWWSGCATLQPGADPFVVNVERSQTMAASTFDFVLNFDNQNRPFWKTNAPAFHDFCSWLRTPLPYGSPATNVPRVIVIQLNVEDVKLAYKQTRNAGNSNALWLAWSVLNQAVSQSSSWSNIVTLPVHP